MTSFSIQYPTDRGTNNELIINLLFNGNLPVSVVQVKKIAFEQSSSDVAFVALLMTDVRQTVMQSDIEEECQSAMRHAIRY